ncbi:MAG: hypothetical protein ACREIA_19490 [Opitutaceae bacterium]
MTPSAVGPTLSVVETRVDLRDGHYPLHVTLCFRAYQAQNVIEQWTEIRHSGRAAFARIVSSVLLEAGLHNPLAAAIGHDGRSEWELTRSLPAQLQNQKRIVQRPSSESAVCCPHPERWASRSPARFSCRCSSIDPREAGG